MASVDVSVKSKLSPDNAWKLASDLGRFDEWLTIFGGWRSPVPEVIEKGTTVSSLIKVKGFRNTIHWEVTNYDEPHRIEMCGKGFGGVQISLRTDIRDDQPGTTFHLVADLSGAVLNGPVGALVARVIKGDVKRSVENLARLQ
ncbi:SRPBCC family protein [Mycobacterium yunnanensis]|uniref:SRPBCC family protein n=1 Tax=Mycobacterium yunnanensis TaxID=368477 RepID=A0A9X3BSR0_9MYCO|nr:SRPBCC family protein [Mycobacterium yunnanensis]MCV7420874.1 SRPBCC family protein [Mycobacterium yunnanensis]